MLLENYICHFSIFLSVEDLEYDYDYDDMIRIYNLTKLQK